jgi:hypothetical protein
MGCPKNDAQFEVMYAREEFELGLMIWVQTGNPGKVFVLPNGADWQEFVDPGPDHPMCDAAKGGVPKRGFGKIWCDNAQELLGKPKSEEIGGPDYPRSVVQEFDHGYLIYDAIPGKIITLYEGGWE